MFDSRIEIIDLGDSRLEFYPELLSDNRAKALQASLDQLDWAQENVRIRGRDIPEPRLTVWFADAGVRYGYTGRTLHNQPWPGFLSELRSELKTLTGNGFNSVLGNLYRDGRDSMGWHSDNEPELGERPVIASLSLGATRRFRIRRKADKAATRHIDLPGGSLLVMSGEFQKEWQHAVPKTARPVGKRINLTFRTIR